MPVAGRLAKCGRLFCARSYKIKKDFVGESAPTPNAVRLVRRVGVVTDVGHDRDDDVPVGKTEDRLIGWGGRNGNRNADEYQRTESRSSHASGSVTLLSGNNI